jgi:hypothetical protein
VAFLFPVDTWDFAPNSSTIQFGPAFEAQVAAFLINVFHVCARPHDTQGLFAMNQTQGMSKFVNHFFDQSLQKQLIICGHSVSFIVQAVNGNDGCVSA